MENYLGITIMAFGLFMFVGGISKSNFIMYRLHVYRSKMLWGESVYGFHLVVGVILIAIGLLATAGIIW
jgi:hypothetical protein